MLDEVLPPAFVWVSVRVGRCLITTWWRTLSASGKYLLAKLASYSTDSGFAVWRADWIAHPAARRNSTVGAALISVQANLTRLGFDRQLDKFTCEGS